MGARAALAHSGSLAGDDALIDAALRQSGAIRVENLTELVSLLALQSGADFVLARYLPRAGIFKGYLRLFEESDGRLVLYTRTGFDTLAMQQDSFLEAIPILPDAEHAFAVLGKLARFYSERGLPPRIPPLCPSCRRG